MDSNIDDKHAQPGTLQLAGVECNTEQKNVDKTMHDIQDDRIIRDLDKSSTAQVSKTNNDVVFKKSEHCLQDAFTEVLQAQKCMAAWKEEQTKNLPLSKQIEILQNVFKKLNILKKMNSEDGKFDYNWKRFSSNINGQERHPQADEMQEKEHNKCITMKQKLSNENHNENVLENVEMQRPIAVEKLTAIEEQQDNIYRKSGEIFLQNVPCYKLRSHLGNFITEIPVCRECHKRHMNLSNKPNDVYCRFYEFRRLRYEPNGQLIVAGFPNPHYDPKQADINIWKPDQYTHPTAGYMDIQICRLILLHIGDQFCYLWRQEAEAFLLHENPYDIIAWKKAVQGIREICDVCDTTVFNYHWTCAECGFTVCLDCYKDRKEKRSCSKVAAVSARSERGRDEFHWLLCVSKSSQNAAVKHELSGLMLTQIITGDALNVLGRRMHELRALWQIPQSCDCLLSNIKFKNNKRNMRINKMTKELIDESQLQQRTVKSSLATKETARLQAEMERMHADKVEFAKRYGIKNYVPGHEWHTNGSRNDPITTAFDKFQHINMYRQGLAGLRRFIPPRTMTMTQSESIIKNVPHEWLCHGKLLRLTNPICPDNRILFQKVWKCGQPVVVSDVDRSLDLSLWRPEAFCRDFGDKPNDLINCLTGNLVPNQPMQHFWEGFQSMQKRLLDANGEPMLLKLKDWPPGDDFAEILPTRFTDLMKGLPMPEYTLRTGNLNLASCLPKMFVPPDLGPKMYNAYGSALYPDRGTTNLHLDISDAVNIMVYVGIPSDSDCSTQLAATQHAIAMGGCDFYTRLRVQRPDVLPGALWHIFAARDADKIRDLLNRVTLENGFRLEPNHDPIHDQNWYLDDKLRSRLFAEYGVQGYPIVQCLGDAVFIPAGAPHQVQNLHNCIKVAEDFVSPENITHCYHLTYEFRRLSHSHTNHEDKLQIKNIIYHAVKDCCTILSRALYERYQQYVMNKYDSNHTFLAGNQPKCKQQKCHTHVHIVRKCLKEKMKKIRKNSVRMKKVVKRKVLNANKDEGAHLENNGSKQKISRQLEAKQAKPHDEINHNSNKRKNNQVTTKLSIDEISKTLESKPSSSVDLASYNNLSLENNRNSPRSTQHSAVSIARANEDIDVEVN